MKNYLKYKQLISSHIYNKLISFIHFHEPFKRQPHKKVKHTQAIRRQFANFGFNKVKKFYKMILLSRRAVEVLIIFTPCIVFLTVLYILRLLQNIFWINSFSRCSLYWVSSKDHLSITTKTFAVYVMVVKNWFDGINISKFSQREIRKICKILQKRKYLCVLNYWLNFYLKWVLCLS